MTVFSSKSVVAVNNLGIRFHSKPPTLHSTLLKLAHEAKRTLLALSRGRMHNPFKNDQPEATGKWIFRNISFEVYEGEILGIIGANGCGKTTLLKILSSVLLPTEGEAQIRGRVAALLAVGTGFNTAYTGRENVYLNGMILGLSKKQIEKQFDKIIDFADIGDAIDMPVRTYSSGMRARLAFSVASQLQSEIVILDEILSVGDAGFREKSLQVIHEMKRSKRTVILVSHNMASIERFCDRAMLLKEGKISVIGEPAEVTEAYLGQFRNDGQIEIPVCEREDRFGSGVLRVMDIYFEINGFRVKTPSNANDVTLCIAYQINSKVIPKTIEVGVGIKEEDGRKITRLSTDVLGEPFYHPPRAGCLSVTVPQFPLSQGNYAIGFRILCDGEMADHIPDALKFQCVEGDFFGTGQSDTHSPVYMKHKWSLVDLTE